MTQIRLGDLLLRAGVVSEKQLDQALAEQKQWGGRLGTQLVRMGALTEDLLVKALSRQLGIPRAALGPAAPLDVPPSILAKLDRATCERSGAVPIRYIQERRTLQLAVSDPFNVVAIDDISRRVGLRVEPQLGGESQVQQAIARLFGGMTNPLGGADPNLFLDNSNRPLNATTTSSAPQAAGGVTLEGFVANGGAAGRQTAGTPSTSTAPTATSMPPTIGSAGPAAATAPPAAPANATATPQQHGPGLEDLQRLAEQQRVALRALSELLVERGVIQRAELAAWLGP